MHIRMNIYRKRANFIHEERIMYRKPVFPIHISYSELELA